MRLVGTRDVARHNVAWIRSRQARSGTLDVQQESLCLATGVFEPCCSSERSFR